jgi:hypothetical protein
MSHLFADGILCILEYLTLNESMQASQTCRAWHHASQSRRRRIFHRCQFEWTASLEGAMASPLAHGIMSLDVATLRFDGEKLQRICSALRNLDFLRLDTPQAYDGNGTPQSSWPPLLLPPKLSTLTCENAAPRFNDRDVAQWLVDGLPSAPGLKDLVLIQHARVDLAAIGQLRQLHRLKLMEWRDVPKADELGVIKLLTVLSRQLTHLTLLRKLAYDQLPNLEFPLLQKHSTAFYERSPGDIPRGPTTPGLYMWQYARFWP